MVQKKHNRELKEIIRINNGMAHKQEMLQQKADNDKIIKKLYYEAKQQLDSLNMEKQELEKKINDQKCAS